jgi:Predicted membrane protein (DUF2142)
MGQATEAAGPTLLERIRRPRAVWFVPVLALLALVAWMFASPVGSSPDDDFHLVSVWCANSANPGCAPGSSSTQRTVPRALVDAPCYAGNQNKSAACQNSLNFSAKPEVETSRGNFDGGYPPVYYAVMSAFAGSQIVVSALLMRLFTIVLFLGITIALYVLLPPARRQTLVLSWAITTIPLGFFLLASNNPSSWAIIGLGSAWQALLGYFESTGRRRVALGGLFVLAVLLAAGARSDAAFYCVVAIGVVVWLTFTRTRGYLVLLILPAVMVVVAVLFFLTSSQSNAGLVGLGNGTAAASGVGGAAPSEARASLSGVGLLAYNLLNVQSLWAGAFGQWALGWLDTPLPALVTFGGTAVFVAVAFIGLSRMTWRKLIVMIGITIVLWALPVFILQKGGNLIGVNVQPRYLLPLIVLLGGVALLTRRNQRLDFSRLQLVVVVATLSLVNFVSLHVNIQRYVSGNNHAGLDLDAHEAWWWQMPFPPDLVWIVGSLAYAAMLAIIVREVSRRGALGMGGAGSAQNIDLSVANEPNTERNR